MSVTSERMNVTRERVNVTRNMTVNVIYKDGTSTWSAHQGPVNVTTCQLQDGGGNDQRTVREADSHAARGRLLRPACCSFTSPSRSSCAASRQPSSLCRTSPVVSVKSLGVNRQSSTSETVMIDVQS